MSNTLRILLFSMTIVLFVSGLFLVFMRHNADKSALWLNASLQMDKDYARQRLDRALVYDPYNPRLWALVQIAPYAKVTSPDDAKAAAISESLVSPSAAAPLRDNAP